MIRNVSLVVLTVLLAVPEGARPATSAAVEAPLELDRNILLVQVDIDGHGPFLAMLDTGTDPSAIDLMLARELALPLGGGGEIDGGGTRREEAFPTQLASVRLGGMVVHDVTALAGESVGRLAKLIGRPLRVVLGKSFLNGRIVQIDFPGRVVRFFASPLADLQPIAGRRAVLAARYDEDLAIEGVRVDDRAVRAILDTGSNGALKITPEGVTRLGLAAQAAQGEASDSTGYRGTYATREGHVRSLSLGGLEVDEPAAVFWSPGTGHDGMPWEVNIGNQVLAAFVVTLDLPDGRVILERPAPRPAP